VRQKRNRASLKRTSMGWTPQASRWEHSTGEQGLHDPHFNLQEKTCGNAPRIECTSLEIGMVLNHII